MITEITSCRGSDPYIFKNTLKRTPNSVLHLSGQIFCAGSEMPYAEEKVHSWHVQSNKSWWLLCWKKYLTGSFKSPSTIPFLAHFCFRNIGLCPPSPLAARGGSRESHNEDSLVGLPFSCSPLSKTPSEPIGGQALLLRCSDSFTTSLPLLEQCQCFPLCFLEKIFPVSSPPWGRCWWLCWVGNSVAVVTSTAITFCIGAHSTLQSHRELLWGANPP